MLKLPLSAIVTIIEHFDWTTLAAWRATSRLFFRHVARHMRRRYLAHVQPFVPDTNAFDELLRMHGAIISGSTALHFFLPDTSWKPRELDIYVPSSSYQHFLSTVSDPTTFAWTRLPGFRRRSHAYSLYPSVFRFIGGGVEETEYTTDEYLSEEDTETYVRQHSPCPCGREHGHTLEETIQSEHTDVTEANSSDSELDADAASDSAEGDGEFFRNGDGDLTDAFVQLEFYTPELPSLVHGKGFSTMRSFRTPSHRRVNIVASYSANPVSPLRYLWTSLMHNFLTPDGCVCGIPSATLRRCGATRVDPLTVREDAARGEYERRGFVFDDHLRDALDIWDYLFFGERKLLAFDFRTAADDVKLSLPISRTDRGWIADDAWRPSCLGVVAANTLSNHE